MFKVGDKVVYPMHGAGVIEAIEEREFLGQKRQYYVMRMPIGDMRVMVPTDATEEVGLRQVISQEDVEQVLAIYVAQRPKCLTIGTVATELIWRKSKAVVLLR